MSTNLAWASLFWLILSTGAFAQSPAAAEHQRRDAEQARILQEGMTLVREGRAREAIERHFDPVIAHYEAQYAGEENQIYCAGGRNETLLVLMMHAAKKSGKGAIAVTSNWCDAYFLKGHALVELGRSADARSVLEQAVARSPYNSTYLVELGYAYAREKELDKAMECFRTAEKASGLAPDEKTKNRRIAQARRGMGFVLIELNRLDEAEAKYRECLDLDSGDALSRHQLEYIRKLRASKSAQ